MAQDKIQVLLVEPDADIRETLVMVLTYAGCDVIGVIDAPSAQDVLASDPVRAAIIDIGFPGQTEGLDLCDAIRRQYPNIKTILMGSNRERLQAAASRCDATFLKPMQMEEFLDSLRSLTR